MRRAVGWMKGLVELVALAVVLVLLLGGCWQGEIGLPFATIERRDAAGTGKVYESREPGLMIIASPQDLAQVDDFVTPDAQVLLQAIDFGEYFAVAVFQGWKPSNSYGAEVQRVTQKDSMITLYVHFTERDPERVAADVVTSPYHLVKVKRPGHMGKEVEFILNADGKVVSSEKHFMP